MSETKNCFVISPIGPHDSDTRKRSDQVLKHVIKPAVCECGYKAIRADDIDKPGIITSQVIQHVVDDPLVIADLTERNPNVFYELAIRHALRKPLVQIMSEGEQIPFDVAATRTIFVDHKDLDSVAEAKTKIRDQIHELEKADAEIETPISVSLDLQSLRQSEKPEDRSLADLLAVMSGIRAELEKIDARMDGGNIEEVPRLIRHEFRKLRGILGDHEEGITSSRTSRIGRFQTMAINEIIESSRNINSATEILMMASLFRDKFPWIYELSLEVYRLKGGRNSEQYRRKLVELCDTVKWTSRNRWMGEISGRERREMERALGYFHDKLLRRAND